MMRKQAPIWKLSQQSGSGLFINFSLSWRAPRNVIKWWCFVPPVLRWLWWVYKWACWMSMLVLELLFSMVAFVGCNSIRTSRCRWRVRSVASEDAKPGSTTLPDRFVVRCYHCTMSIAFRKKIVQIATCMDVNYVFLAITIPQKSEW